MLIRLLRRLPDDDDAIAAVGLFWLSIDVDVRDRSNGASDRARPQVQGDESALPAESERAASLASVSTT